MKTCYCPKLKASIPMKPRADDKQTLYGYAPYQDVAVRRIYALALAYLACLVSWHYVVVLYEKSSSKPIEEIRMFSFTRITVMLMADTRQFRPQH